MFVLVLADLGSPIQRAVKQLLLYEHRKKKQLADQSTRLYNRQHTSTCTSCCAQPSATNKKLIGPVLSDPPPSVSLSGTPVDRVTVFKLLGVNVASDLKWSQHVDRRRPHCTSIKRLVY